MLYRRPMGRMGLAVLLMSLSFAADLVVVDPPSGAHVT
jgi:hypothetical protein